MQNIHEKKFESINDVRAQQSGESMPKKDGDEISCAKKLYIS